MIFFFYYKHDKRAIKEDILLSHGYDFATAVQRLSRNVGILTLIILSFSNLCHVIEVITK